MHRFANPTRFLRLANAILPWLGGLTLILFGVGLYQALLISPADYQQGETVRIMYVHVPAAWAALAGYASLAIASFAFLVWRHPLADLAARAASPIGAGFTAIALVTGALWGQPMWGTWWVWDARLTSVLILFFLYLGHMALVNAFDDSDRGGRAGAVLALVGVVNLPVIKFSVDWWNTLHQPASVLRMGGPTIAGEMMTPLMIMAGAYFALFGVLMILRIRALLAARRLRQLRLATQQP
jgi:heme exporter protein C